VNCVENEESLTGEFKVDRVGQNNPSESDP